MKQTFIDLQHPYKLLKIRVDYDANKGHTEMLDIIDGYLTDRKYIIIRSGCGLHTEKCSNTHFHYHLEIDDKFVKGAEGKYSKNKYISKNSLKIPPNSISVVQTSLTTDISGTTPEESIMRFLGYPLKEIKPIETHCIGIDISACATYANAEWRNVRRQKELNEQKDADDKLRWTKIVNHLDEKELKDYTSIFKELINYTRGQNPPVTLKNIETKTMNYIKERNIYNDDDIIQAHHNGQGKYLYEKDKRARVPPLGNYDLGDISNEQMKLIKMALSKNYNL